MVFIRINWTLWTVVLDTARISIPKTFKTSLIQTQGAQVLENGFSVETMGWDFICNMFSVS